MPALEIQLLAYLQVGAATTYCTESLPPIMSCMPAILNAHLPATDAPAATPPTVSAVSIKLPPFWPADPQVWFAQLEAQFQTHSITSLKTCFNYVITSLAPEFAVKVRDLLIRPPADNPYNTLKAELIKRTAASEQCKLQQLISREELGDRKPTQLLRWMPSGCWNRNERLPQGTLPSTLPSQCSDGPCLR